MEAAGSDGGKTGDEAETGRGEADADGIPALVAPAVWTGYSPHHLSFDGTLTIGFEWLLGVLEDLAASGVGGGFDAIVLVNGHGGNAALVDGAASTIGVAHPETEIVGVTCFELAAELLEEIRESEPGGMAHGGEFETSLMLHLHPELVGEERAGTLLEPPTNERERTCWRAAP